MRIAAVSNGDSELVETEEGDLIIASSLFRAFNGIISQS